MRRKHAECEKPSSNPPLSSKGILWKKDGKGTWKWKALRKQGLPDTTGLTYKLRDDRGQGLPETTGLTY